MTGEYISPRQARAKKRATEQLKQQSDARIGAANEKQRTKVAGCLWELFEQIRDTEFPNAENIEIVKNAGKIAHLLYPSSVVDTDELINYGHDRLSYRVLNLTKGYKINPVQFIAYSEKPAPTKEALLLETGHVVTRVTPDSREKVHKGKGQYWYGGLQAHDRHAIAVFRNDLIPIRNIEEPELYKDTFEELAAMLGVTVTQTEALVEPITEIGN